VLGSSGFISDSRRFSEIVERILPWAEGHNWLINLLCSRHARHNQYASYVAEERRLQRLATHSAHFRLQIEPKTSEELHTQLRACDLLWCWTSVASRPYASGTCSDQYCSGTRLILADKQQHSCLYGLPNVVFTPPDFEAFMAALHAELRRGHHPRHDGRMLSWQERGHAPADFLRFVATLPV